MEEKEPIKLRLSTAILVLIILVLIGGIAYFVIQNNDLQRTKGENANQVETLQTQVKELENIVNEKQNVSNNEINTNNVNTVNTNTKTTSTNTSSSSNTNIKSNNNSTGNTKDKYAEITKKFDLNDEERFVITDVEKNEGKYLLKGRVYTKYTLTKSEYNNAKKTGKININGKEYTVKTVKQDEDSEILELHAQSDKLTYYIADYDGTYELKSGAQNAECYKATNDYKKIIVEENTRCVHTNWIGISDEEEVLENTTVKDYFKNFKSITKECRDDLLPSYNFEFKNGKCTKITITTNWI